MSDTRNRLSSACRPRRVARIVLGLVVAILAASRMLLGGTPASAAEPNPAWPASCPQRVVLVLDLSSSTEPYIDDIKQSAQDLVDALRGAPNQVAVVGFGTSASVDVAPLDAGDAAQRERLKTAVEDLQLSLGDGGGTNWEDALRTAASLRPDVVLFLTDGQPTVAGTASSGFANSSDALSPAVAAADSIRASGTRIVGVGIGLQQSSVANLVQVTGPTSGDDYYETSSDAGGLLDRLYDVASKTCGIPVAALPQPEGGQLPILPIVGGVIAAALLAALGGYLLSRRGQSGPVAARPERRKLVEETVRTAGPPSGSDMGADASTPPLEPEPEVPAPGRRSGRLSRARLDQITADDDLTDRS